MHSRHLICLEEIKTPHQAIPPRDEDFEERKSVGEMNLSDDGKPGQAGKPTEGRRPSPR
jgi:hypothetical protein